MWTVFPKSICVYEKKMRVISISKSILGMWVIRLCLRCHGGVPPYTNVFKKIRVISISKSICVYVYCFCILCVLSY